MHEMVTVTEARRYRVYPRDAAQVDYLHRMARADAKMWNNVIAERTGVHDHPDDEDRWSRHENIKNWRALPDRYVTLQRPSFSFIAYPARERTEFPYSSVPGALLQGIPRRVQAAKSSYHTHIKNGDKDARPPGYRKSVSFSYQLQTNSERSVPSDWVRYDGGRWAYVRLRQPADKRYRIADPWVRIRYHRTIPDDARLGHFNASYDRRLKCWHVTLVIVRFAEREITVPSRHIGVDLGVEVLAATYEHDLQTGSVESRMLPNLPCACGGSHRSSKCDPLERRLAELKRQQDRRHYVGSPACYTKGGHLHADRKKDAKNGKGCRPCEWPKADRPQRFWKAKREISAISAKLARRRRNHSHHIAKALVDGTEEGRLIVFEALQIQNMTKSAKGTLEKPGRNVKQKSGLNREINRQNWGQVMQFTEQKAARASLDGRHVEVARVPPHHTSQTCPQCAATDPANRKGRAFQCRSCGYQDHADTVGARNVLTRHLTSTDGATHVR